MQFSNMSLTEGNSAERVNCLACCTYIYIYIYIYIYMTLQNDFDLGSVTRILDVLANLADKTGTVVYGCTCHLSLFARLV